jgi:MFS transporter, YNFM family, putative membrane transport protein
MSQTHPGTLAAGVRPPVPLEPTHLTQSDGAVQDQPAPRYPASTGRVLLLVATALLVLTQLYAAIPLAGPVGDDLGGGVTFALSTVYGLCYAAGFLFWGPTADSYGNKRVMIIGLAGLTALTVACAFAPSVPVLAVLRGLQGFAAASFPPTALAYLAVATSPRFRTTAIGAVSTSFLVSGILGQLFASTIAQRLGWNWVFIVSAIALAVMWLVIVLLVTEPSRQPGSGRVLSQFVAALRLAQRPTVRLLCAAHVTLLLSFVAMYTDLGAHLTTLGLDSSQTLLLRLVGLPGMFAALLVGPLSRRLSLAAIARTGVLVGALGLLVEALLASTLAGTAAASLVFVTGISLAVSAMISLFGEAAAPHRAGGMALNGFVLFLGASIGPLAAAVGLSFSALLTGLAALLAAAAICLTGYARLQAASSP